VDETVTITVTKAEALVLFELLAEFSNAPALSIPGEAERISLRAVQASLEKALVEPFMEDYQRIVDDARKELVAKWGSSEEGLNT